MAKKKTDEEQVEQVEQVAEQIQDADTGVVDVPINGGDPAVPGAPRSEREILHTLDLTHQIEERLLVETEEALRETGASFNSRGINALIKAVAVVMAELRMDIDDIQKDLTSLLDAELRKGGR